ncbi:MAG: hypothetical protein RIQ60_3405 [Pseudomonadota bacterium]|jgi:hypothetical protein
MNQAVPGADTLQADRVWRLSGFGAAELADNARAAASGAVTGVLALAGFVVLALWVTVGLVLQRDKAAETHQAEASLHHMTLAFAEHASRVFSQADLLARQVRSDWRRQGKAIDLAASLHAYTGNVPAGPLLQVSVLGSDGQLLASSLGTGGNQGSGGRAPTAARSGRSSDGAPQQPATGKDYFAALARGGTDDTPYLSRTQLDDSLGQWVMHVGRRLEDGEGRFAGVVLVTVQPSFVSRFFGEASLGRQGLIALIGHDGQVRARAAANGQIGGLDQSSSALFREMTLHKRDEAPRAVSATSPVDGVERLYAYRSLNDFQAFAVAARSQDEIYTDSRLRAQTWLAVGGLVTVVIAVLTMHALHRARQQAELLQALSLSRQKADLANELRSRFLLDLADGMREPMQAILERAEALRDTHADPRARAEGRKICDAARQMGDRFCTMFESSAPAPLDAIALANAAIEQASGGSRVDTADARPGPVQPSDRPRR